MIAIEEGDYLRFEFDDGWDQVRHWDRDDAFKDGIHGVEKIRALDIIALSSTRRECLLMEVKDFRDQNDEEAAAIERTRRKRKGAQRHKHRREGNGGPSLARAEEAQDSSALIEQVAHKVVGTLAGLVGASRMQDTDFATGFVDALAKHRRHGYKVRVVLWVEGQPTSKGKSSRNKAHLSALTAKLKRKLGWLTGRPVQVLSSVSESTIPGLEVVDTR